MENKEINDLRNKETEYLQKLHDIVNKAIEEEKLITTNLLNPPKEIITPGESLSDKVAQFGGSWNFIILFGVILVFWISYNVFAATAEQFDPYPFILMNLVLSCIAALQAPIIMMSQNRKEEKDRKRNENDYLINLKAEMEIRSMQQKLDLLLEDQIKTLYESQTKQLELLKNLDEKIDKLEKNNSIK
jgi:uncharacterized membrane protein